IEFLTPDFWILPKNRILRQNPGMPWVAYTLVRWRSCCVAGNLQPVLCLTCLGPLLPCTAPVLPASALLDQLLEHRTVLAPREFGQGLLLQLPHPLTADPEEGANSLKAPRLVRVQPVPQPHNARFAFGQVCQGDCHATAYLLLRHTLIRLRRLGIRQHLLERHAIGCDRLLQPGQGLDSDQERFHLLGRPAQGGTEVLPTRRAILAPPQSRDCSAQLALALEHIPREPDRVVVLADRPADGLSNPPVGVRDKFQPAARLKLVHRAHQPEIAFLN